MEICTKDGSHWQGKRKIFLSMHPVDRILYFEPIKAAIWQAGDFAICYHNAPNDADKHLPPDLFALISAVSEKYITWQNSGFVSEAKAAIASGIPLIPVMLEEGLDNLFNTRCAKLHYVARCDEKAGDHPELVRHLQRMLSDKAGIAVKREEKPCIFISYRKKDRQALDVLVKQLGAHRDAERVQIWYDTSLVPGEAYSQTILQKIRSCDLFLLLVTPHMLEEGNFVRRVEYPLAKESGRHILPVLMEKTDLQALKACFEGLPRCIASGQTDAVFAWLFGR